MKIKEIIFHTLGITIIISNLIIAFIIIFKIFSQGYIRFAEPNLIILIGELIYEFFGIIYCIYLVKIIRDKIKI